MYFNTEKMTVSEKKAKDLELDKDTIQEMKNDIEWAKENKENWIQYYCF